MKRRDFLKGVIGVVVVAPVLVVVKKAEGLSIPSIEEGKWSGVCDPLGDIECFNDSIKHPPEHWNCRSAVYPIIGG